MKLWKRRGEKIHQYSKGTAPTYLLAPIWVSFIKDCKTQVKYVKLYGVSPYKHKLCIRSVVLGLLIGVCFVCFLRQMFIMSCH